MKYTTTSLSLLGLAAAASIPAPRDIVRVLPRGWSFNITALSGPGCPDFGKDPNAARTTRLTFGQNTMDGSEIYYWFGAYPWMRVNLEKGKDSTWCETEVSYFEYSNYTNEVPSEDYRLRLHKNGTREIATYDLEEGVKATFDFSYKVAGKKFSDKITLEGPTASGQYAKDLVSKNPAKPELYPVSKCGSGKFTFRTELSVEGKKGKKGIVESENSVYPNGERQYYGAQQGFSHDWEKC